MDREIHELQMPDLAASDWIAELGDGFEWAQADTEEKEKQMQLEGELPGDLQTSHYVVPITEAGTYQISWRVKLVQDVQAMNEIQPKLYLFAGRKQLLWFGSAKAGEVLEGSRYLHVSEVVPRNGEQAIPVTQIGFAVACSNRAAVGIPQVRVRKVSEDAGVPTIYLAGDSTVTDQPCQLPYQPGGCYCAWGQELAFYLGGCAAVDNQAQSGFTTETFRTVGHYAIVRRHSKPGDYCLFQFAHNDQKLAHLMARTGYRENLIRYIDELREAGVHPVLVTPLARNSWKEDGTYNDLLSEYSDEVKAIGQEKQVPVIDLHEYSKNLIQKLGKADVCVYYHPGDMTHTNEYGAWLFAGFIAEELSRLLPRIFRVERLTDAQLLPETGGGETGSLHVKGEKTQNQTADIAKKQQEAFDSMERAGAALIDVIEQAKREAAKLEEQ